jgi:CubicO group peptidase (beta-lactamase class C family)
MDGLRAGLERVIAEHDFSGVVRVEREGGVRLVSAHGLADRAYGIANTVDTQFGLASAAKGITALAVVSLVADGLLELRAPVRPLLGDDLPEIDAGVTVEHLLAHRSGIGDYFDEDLDLDITDYVMPVPVHRLAATEDYLVVLSGHPAKFPPGQAFSYCNSGYVVLALVVERVTGTPFHDVVAERVLTPAGMADTAYHRSDELPGRAARGYLTVEGLRTNVLHLPVRGSGDGGVYSTAGDLHRLWDAFLGGRIVSPEWVKEMVRPRSDVPQQGLRYGLGFWLYESTDALLLEGHDAGVSFRTVHDPVQGLTWTVVSNTSNGAWPVVRHLRAALRD